PPKATRRSLSALPPPRTKASTRVAVADRRQSITAARAPPVTCSLRMLAMVRGRHATVRSPRRWRHAASHLQTRRVAHAAGSAELAKKLFARHTAVLCGGAIKHIDYSVVPSPAGGNEKNLL